MLDHTIQRFVTCIGGGMCQRGWADVGAAALLLVSLWVALKVVRRLSRVIATLRATAWMPVSSRWLARWVGRRDYSDVEFFRADAAEEPCVERRRGALAQLAARLRAQQPLSIAWASGLRESFSDLRFTDANRVPFPFMHLIRKTFALGSVVTASRGPRLQSLDGDWTIDVSGSYGLNVAGFDRYKEWMAKGWERTKELGPVLGPLHPLVADNIVLLKRISGLDEVSFHMSGTEAVMAAVRLARFNTRRQLIVCFSGAYHGWWDGVQPGLGSERPIDDCLTLRDLHPASLDAIRLRSDEIAGVLVNPVQSFHPNSPPPNDAILLTSEVRTTEASTERYARWLRDLRQVCDACDIPLIFDEVYTGFRLAPGGAQEYFDVRADLVVYGKTVGGGMPVGVVCGRAALMGRFDPERPMRIAYVVGTFSAHPLVMGAMNEFLHWVVEPRTADLYEEANESCAEWVRSTNEELLEASLPVRVVNLGTIWTVLFEQPGRYNWLMQYYLRAEGVTLSWVGTGRCLASMDFTEADYTALQEKLVGAARQMNDDGWWLEMKAHPEREARMRKRLMKEMLGSVVHVPAPLQSFYAAVMQRKEDDHHASHSNGWNQLLHLVSSSVFVYCYVSIFADLTSAMCLGLASLLVRQFGHAILEPACHDKEEHLLGYTTRDKTLIVAGYLAIPLIGLAQAGVWTFGAFATILPTIALHWFRWTVFVVLLRVVYLAWKHDARVSMIWFVKLVTDPFTDIATYFPRRAHRA